MNTHLRSVPSFARGPALRITAGPAQAVREGAALRGCGQNPFTRISVQTGTWATMTRDETSGFQKPVASVEEQDASSPCSNTVSVGQDLFSIRLIQIGAFSSTLHFLPLPQKRPEG